MDSKPLLYGLIGFFLGGLLVAIAATTFDKPSAKESTHSTTSNMSMRDMASGLEGKSGDDFDKAFIKGMIIHHEGAVAMAKLSAQNAKHDEIRQLSTDIISAQEKEITQMKQWQSAWGYAQSSDSIQMNN